MKSSAALGDVYAVIPARGGSKRIKDKNSILINNKPLIAYSIETAFESGIFSKIIVNSDDAEILAISEQYNAESYRRPEQLASDNAYIIDVVREMIFSLKLSDDTVLGIILPTCPLRSAEDIKAAHSLFIKNGGEFPVSSVASYDTPIQLAHFIGDDGRLEAVFLEDYKKSTRSTDHRKAYHYNEAIIFNKIGNLKLQNNLIGDRPIPYIMPSERSIIIDYPYQLEIIKKIMARSLYLNE